jgi:hypothetical protein
MHCAVLVHDIIYGIWQFKCPSSPHAQIRDQIRDQGKTRSLGLFRGEGAEERAARAYDTAARELHREAGTLNFPSVSEQQADVEAAVRDLVQRVVASAQSERRTSRFRGVSWKKGSNSWYAQMACSAPGLQANCVRSKTRHVGFEINSGSEDLPASRFL